MLLGGGRLTGTCWRSACRQANFRNLEGAVVSSPQRQGSIQCNSSSSFSNLAHFPSSSAKNSSIILAGPSSTTSSILSEVEIRRKSGLYTKSKKLSDYTDLFAAHFVVFRKALQSHPKALRFYTFLQTFSSSKAGSKKQQRVVHLPKPSHTEGQRPASHTEGPQPDSPEQPDTQHVVPSNFMFWFIMGLNVIVFGMWQLAISQAEQGDPTLFFLMFKNFTSGLSNFFEGRYWTLLTACFSHKDYAHMFVNMLTYFFFGRTILNLVGGRSFLFFYFAAGLASSSLSLFSDFLGHDASRPKEGQQKKPQFSLGASGSIIAIVTCFSSIKPRATFLFYFILPVQARLLIPALLLYDLWGMFGTEPHKTLWDKNTFVDSAGHVGGIIAGRLYWIFKLKRFRVMW